jgi:hypothetical protein
MNLIAQDRYHTSPSICRETKLLKRVVIPEIKEYHAIADEVEWLFRRRVELFRILTSEDHQSLSSIRTCCLIAKIFARPMWWSP